jgi:hypothetical protein
MRGEGVETAAATILGVNPKKYGVLAGSSAGGA